LFYTQIGATFQGRDILGDFSIERPAYIDRDNELFKLEQLAFCEPLANMLLEAADFVQLRNFYFNIFCHSRLTRLSRQFIDCLDEKCKDFGEFLEWSIERFDRILAVYFCCNVTEIVHSLSEILMKIAGYTPARDSIRLFQLFVDALAHSHDRWRALPEIMTLVHDYMELGAEQKQVARKSQWLNAFLDFVANVFEDRSQTFKESADLSPLLDSIYWLMDMNDKDIMGVLLPMIEDFRLSYKHFPSFKKILVKGAKSGIYEFSEIVRLIPSDFPVDTLLSHFLSDAAPDTFERTVRHVASSFKVLARDVLQFLTIRENAFHACLIANCQFLFDYFHDGFASESAANLLHAMCNSPDVQIVLDEMKDRLCKGKVPSVFLRELLAVLKKVDYPRDQLLLGLEKQDPGRELRHLFTYFGSMEGIIFELKDFVRNPTRLFASECVDKLDELLGELQNSSNEVFADLFKADGWCQLIEKIVKEVTPNQYHKLKKVMVIL
jgi:hypothetical protein